MRRHEPDAGTIEPSTPAASYAPSSHPEESAAEAQTREPAPSGRRRGRGRGRARTTATLGAADLAMFRELRLDQWADAELASAAVDPLHDIVLDDGRFARTSRAEFDRLFDAYAAVADTQPLVLHFHGGLVSEAGGLTIARHLTPRYEAAGAYPAFVVWRSGLWEVLRRNLPLIAGEAVFRRLVHLVLRGVARKLGAEFDLDAVLAAVPARDEPDPLPSPDAVEETLAPQLAALGSRAAITREEEATFAQEVELDPSLQAELERIATEPPESAYDLMEEPTLARLPSGEPAHARASAFTLMSPYVVLDIRARAVAASSAPELAALPLGRVALGAAKVLVRVVTRLVNGRDHGVYATVLEELLRELYLANAARGVWSSMKGETEDGFRQPGSEHGGRALIDRLAGLVAQGRRPRVVLVGHSAGAIYVCQFLKAADAALRRLSTDATRPLTFDVVLLAPACRYDLFADVVAQHGARIARFRMFAMQDAAERATSCLGADPALRVIYPHSLLYFVSGVCEREADAPLLGMERYFGGTQGFPASQFPAIGAIRAWLSAGARTVWSPTAPEAPAGFRSQAVEHTAFDEDPETLESIAVVLRDADEQDPTLASAADATFAAARLEGFPAGVTERATTAAAETQRGRERVMGEFTGDYVVSFPADASGAVMRAMAMDAGLASVVAESATEVGQIVDVGRAAMFPLLGMAVLPHLDAMQLARVQAPALAEAALAVERAEVIVAPERWAYLSDDGTTQFPPQFLDGVEAGMRAVLNEMRARNRQGAAAPPAVDALAAATQRVRTAWHLDRTGVLVSTRRGRGVRIAVIDTGFDPAHPDFAAEAAAGGNGRVVHPPVSLVRDSAVDVHGHGTHCLGTAGGPLAPASGTRYGTATGADIFPFKVFTNDRRTAERYFIAGFDAALRASVDIISLSVVFGVAHEEADRAFQRIIRRATQANALVVAACGNDSKRTLGLVAPVRRPAAYPGVLAVAALDASLQVCAFSNGGVGGSRAPDLAAPGRDILSSYPFTPFTLLDSGTSMATPLVAGIAALWAEATGLRGEALGATVLAECTPLPAPASDVGAGLVRAPA